MAKLREGGGVNTASVSLLFQCLLQSYSFKYKQKTGAKFDMLNLCYLSEELTVEEGEKQCRILEWHKSEATGNRQ